MSKRNERPWLVITLGVLCIVAIVVAYTTVGQASQSTAQSTRTATVAKGVVQSTVSGSGNLQSASQLNLGFKTSGVVTHIYVTQGQHVTEGQLLATLNSESAEVTLAQAKANLQSAEANLSQEEESDGETSTGQNSSTGSAVQASTASVHSQSVALTTSTPATTPQATTPASTPTTTTTPTTTAPTSTTTTPSTTTTTPTTPTTTSTPTQTSTSRSKSPAKTTPSAGASKEGEQQSGGSSPTKATVSSATREANLASAKAAVKSDRLTVQSDEEAVQDTKLYAPQDGTIVTLSGEVGETASASGTTKASSSSSSSSSTSTGTGASALGGASTDSSNSSSTGSSSSSSFAVLSDLSSMQLVAALSESEIGNVHVRQIATVTVEALSGAKLAAHVSEVATLSTSSSGAVSYDVTFQLDQMAAGLKPGMSATAEVVVKQAEGINVPTSAITAGSVTVERAGKQVSQAVTTGLAGNSSTIILSGLKAGETVVLPAASTTGSSGASLTSRLGGLSKSGGLGGGLGGGGGFPGGGGGFPAGGPP